MPKDKNRTAKLVGGLLTDANLRERFYYDREGVIEEYRLGAVDAVEIEKLTKLNSELLETLRPGTTTALHCEVASSVGYA